MCEEFKTTDDQRENTVIFDESWEILDQAADELTRHDRAMPQLAFGGGV